MMKKALFIFALLGIAAMTWAQDETQVLNRNASRVYYQGTAADTVLNTDTWDFAVDIAAKAAAQLYHLVVSLDSVSGTPAHTAYLRGSFDGSNFVDIDSVEWAGSSSDTTFYFSDLSTGILYDQVWIHLVGSSSSKSKVDFIEGKFVNKND